MPVYNNYNNQYGLPRQNVPYGGYDPYMSTVQQTPQIQPRSSDGRVYVNGRAGADAYPLPIGVNFMVLWDTESHRFFVKGYDNNGIPRVLEDNDYTTHVEPETSQQSVDLSTYATKDDIKNMIAQAFSNATIPSMAGYVTKEYFDKALSELSVGNGGRIVRTNESNG